MTTFTAECRQIYRRRSARADWSFDQVPRKKPWTRGISQILAECLERQGLRGGVECKGNVLLLGARLCYILVIEFFNLLGE
jgi:hypothetical protein